MARDKGQNRGVQQGTHQEGRNSERTGQTNRRAQGDNQMHERATRGGNKGSEGQNIDERRDQDEHTGKKDTARANR